IHNLSIISVVLFAALLAVWIHGQKRHLIIILVINAAIIAHSVDMIASNYDKDSMEKISQTIKTIGKTTDEVVLYNEYYQDLPIYLKRKITLVGWEKTELSFGAKHEDVSAWLIDDKEFWKRWLKNDNTMFLVMREDTYKRLTNGKTAESLHFYPVMQDGRNILIINKIPEQQKK
ncbi:MAG: hypothetical protein WCJ33_01020, partial [Pseudomonadota bacterium]